MQTAMISHEVITDKRTWIVRVSMICAVLAVFSMLTANPLLTAACLALPPFLFALLWRPGEPSVLLFAATFQWLQVFAPILNADIYGEELGDSLWLPEMRIAAVLGLITVAILAIGMRLGVRNYSVASANSLHADSRHLSRSRLAVAYIFAFLLGQVVTQVGFMIPGGRQQLLALTSLRWVVSFLIGWAALKSRSYRPLAGIVLVAEVVIGFAGYFSGFKSILFLAVLLIASVGVRARRLFRPSLMFVFLVILLLTSFWQAVKDDYRTFLNAGTGGQFVLVPVTDRFGYLIDRAADLHLDELQSGLASGLDRLGYLEFFARSIRMVPNAIPHQSGRLWLEALKHMAMPRILFPNKPDVNDSDRTNEFSGVLVAGAEEGTSISIGYAGESYIDFGPVWMFLPIFALGWFWGWAYRWLGSQTRHRLLGAAFSTTLILGNALYFESSNIKLVGGAVSSLLVLTVLLRYFADGIWRFVAPMPANAAAVQEVLPYLGDRPAQSESVPFLS